MWIWLSGGARLLNLTKIARTRDVLGEDVKQVWKEEKAKKLKKHLKKLLKMNIMMMSGLFMIYKPLWALVYFK